MRLQVLLVKDQHGREAEIDERNLQDKTRQGKTRPTRQDKTTRQDKARQEKTRYKDNNLCGKPAEGQLVYRSIPGIQLVMVMVMVRFMVRTRVG